MPALRLVKVQLKPLPKPDAYSDERADDTKPGMIRDYEARRCHVCQATHPSFGFGPPMTMAGAVLWACAPHRGDVERMLLGEPSPAKAPEQQLSLL